MNKKLIIVESPSKSKTIESYLKGDALVLSSKGHVVILLHQVKMDWDLTSTRLSTNYKIIPGKQKVIKELIEKSKNRDVLIATDPDREGEAIGWHLAELLNLDLKANNRIIFREITKEAVTEALAHPRPIDQNLVNSQEARRILDRIIGFKLSKLLQSKIKSKSAGRVQSVALKLIVDLEKEIEAFEPLTYYELEAHFQNVKQTYVNPKKGQTDKR
jgi:DNA topoisomerase I